MKNISLLLLLLTTFISCSKSETEEENTIPIPQELLGSWEFKGYFSHDIHDENGPVFFPVTNGSSVITFNNNNTFNQVLNNYLYSGTFTITNDNKLTMSYNSNPNGFTGGGSSKIITLTENELKISCYQGNYCDVDLYEKVASN